MSLFYFWYFSSFFLCLVGMLGCFVIRYNLLIILISLELVLVSLMFLFIVAACYLDDISGFIFYFILLTLAGVEAAIGLSFLILFYRLRGILNLRYLHLLKS